MAIIYFFSSTQLKPNHSAFSRFTTHFTFFVSLITLYLIHKQRTFASFVSQHYLRQYTIASLEKERNGSYLFTTSARMYLHLTVITPIPQFCLCVLTFLLNFCLIAHNKIIYFLIPLLFNLFMTPSNAIKDQTISLRTGSIAY